MQAYSHIPKYGAVSLTGKNFGDGDRAGIVEEGKMALVLWEPSLLTEMHKESSVADLLVGEFALLSQTFSSFLLFFKTECQARTVLRG